jgi:N-acetylmuramoyl-L-alanine amidase
MKIVLRAFLASITLTAIAGIADAHPLTDDEHCLALAMYWEARGEGRDGMIAVGAVVLNRAQHERFPDTVCAVVSQGGPTPPCQFSWYCNGRSNGPREQEAWARAQELARKMLTDPPKDPTRGALFFHNASVRPSWRNQLVRTAQIGGHVFYRSRHPAGATPPAATPPGPRPRLSASGSASRRGSRRSRAWSCDRASRPRRI